MPSSRVLFPVASCAILHYGTGETDVLTDRQEEVKVQ